MKIQENTRFEVEPSTQPQILAYTVRVNTNIINKSYVEDGIEKHYWLVDVIEYDKAEWYQKQLEDLKNENMQLWDTVSYLLKQTGDIPQEII